MPMINVQGKKKAAPVNEKCKGTKGGKGGKKK